VVPTGPDGEREPFWRLRSDYRLGQASVDEEVGRAFHDRGADPQPGPVSLGVVDQMSTPAA